MGVKEYKLLSGRRFMSSLTFDELQKDPENLADA
jgi:hypothetical protein